MSKISIITPLYNKVDYIQKTIQSVLDQTNVNWEYIIVDDGSTDGSFQRVEEFLFDSRIILKKRSDYFNDLKGANVCRNIGAEIANGEYLLFLDADDLLLRNCVEQRLAVVTNEEEQFDLFIFNVAYCKGEPPIAYEKIYPSKKELFYVRKLNYDLNQYFLSAFLSFDLIWHTSGALWLKSYFDYINGFDINFDRLQDPEIHSKALILNAKVKYLKNKFGYDILHRKDEDRVVWDEETFINKQLNSFFYFIEKFYTYLVERGLEEKYVRYLAGYIVEIEKLLYRYERDGSNNVFKKEIRKRIKGFYDNPIFSRVLTKRLCSLIFLNRIFNINIINKSKLRGLIFILYKKYLLPKYVI